MLSDRRKWTNIFVLKIMNCVFLSFQLWALWDTICLHSSFSYVSVSSTFKVAGAWSWMISYSAVWWWNPSLICSELAIPRWRGELLYRTRISWPWVSRVNPRLIFKYWGIRVCLLSIYVVAFVRTWHFNHDEIENTFRIRLKLVDLCGEIT